MPQFKQYKNVHAIIWMLLNSLATTILYCVGKYITGSINAIQVVFLYKLVVLVGIVPWLLHNGIDLIRTNKFLLHLVRGFFSTIGGLLFFYGLSKVDIGNAIALSKIEPIFLMIIGIFYFKETLSIPKFISFAISFLGMVFVMYPIVIMTDTGIQIPWLHKDLEITEFNYNYLIVLGAMLSWSVNSSVVKLLGRTESNQTQLFYVSVISVLLTLPIALFEWDIQSIAGFNILWISKAMSFADINITIIGLILFMGLLYFIHASCNFQAFKIGEMSVIVPFDYSKLVFGGIAGYCLFNSVPSFSACVGYFLILASGIYLLKIQANEKRKRLNSV